MYIDDFYSIVLSKVFPQLGNIDIHAAAGKVTVVPPDMFECYISVERFVLVLRKQPQ